MRQSPKISRRSLAVKSLIVQKSSKSPKKAAETAFLDWSEAPKGTAARDVWGAELIKALDQGKKEFQLKAPRQGFEAGIAFEMATYRFLKHWKALDAAVTVSFEGDREGWEQGLLLGQAVNLARHLTNLPPNTLDTRCYSEFLHEHFAGQPNTEVTIWEPETLKKAGCHLLYATGQGAAEGARLVRVRYAPKKARSKKPVILVGKGIVFDSGGLDIKSSSGMRLMKKDMAGSATVAGIMHWLTRSKADIRCDAYFPLAENSVSSNSMHPGDVILSKGGHWVEIHNTDAEGRLVLADAISMAFEELRKEKLDGPAALFDFATLTGAMRVALGPRIAGFFSDDDRWAERFYSASLKVGEPAWRMPLFREYENYHKSAFADFANASDSGFAGAITAALFLQKFVEKGPWIHVDMFGWAEKPYGAYAEAGGNGQCVQIMAELLKKF